MASQLYSSSCSSKYPVLIYSHMPRHWARSKRQEGTVQFSKGQKDCSPVFPPSLSSADNEVSRSASTGPSSCPILEGTMDVTLLYRRAANEGYTIGRNVSDISDQPS